MKTQTKSARNTKTANVVMTRAITSIALATAIVIDYRAGVSIARLSDRYNFGQDSIRTLLVANGVTIRGRGRYPAAMGN